MTITIKHRYTDRTVFETDADTLGRANLTGANLSWADLRGADLIDADLRGADLRGANLTFADLRGANLTGADLRGASLRGASLRGANLTGANLTFADLTFADLRGANLTGAIRYEGEAIERFTCIDNIGSRNDTLTVFKCTSGIFIETGCFVGTLTQFECAVLDTHGDNVHGKAYTAAIKFIKALFS